MKPSSLQNPSEVSNKIKKETEKSDLSSSRQLHTGLFWGEGERGEKARSA